MDKCPNCGSTDIYKDEANYSDDDSVKSMVGYTCNDCGRTKIKFTATNLNVVYEFPSPPTPESED